MSNAERRRRTFVDVGGWTHDAFAVIARDGVMLSEMIEQSRKRQAFAADSRGCQVASLEMLARGDDMRARHDAEFSGPAEKAGYEDLFAA